MPARFTADDYAAAGRALLPRGRVWPDDPASQQGRAMAAIGQTLARSDAAAIALLLDARPVAPVDLLPEWEATLGLPDPCLGPSPTLSQRQAQVAARFIAGGGQSIGYYTRYAAALGVTITVRTYRPFQAGVDAVGQPLWGEAWAFAWGVNVVADADAFGDEALRCELDAIKPAHTVISYLT